MNLPFFSFKKFKKADDTPSDRLDMIEQAVESGLNRVDKLARERTLLANERTLLAYQRTSISLFLLALALIQFTNDRFLARLGYLVFFLGISIVAFSLVHFQTKQDRISHL
jgi:putative membrane protein